jgi:hypothetical protein
VRYGLLECSSRNVGNLELFRRYLNQQERGVVVFVAEAARRLRSAAARAPRGLTSTTRAATPQPTPSSLRMPVKSAPAKPSSMSPILPPSHGP